MNKMIRFFKHIIIFAFLIVVTAEAANPVSTPVVNNYPQRDFIIDGDSY